MPRGSIGFAGRKAWPSVGPSQASARLERAGRDVTRNVLPLPGSLRTVNIAAEHLGQPFADRQAQAGAAESPGGGGVGLGERLEQLGDLLWVMPMPVSMTSNSQWRASAPRLEAGHDPDAARLR